MIKAVIFDLDGVIVDSKDLHYRAWNIFLGNKNKKGINKKEFNTLFGSPNSKIVEKYFGYIPRSKFEDFISEKEKIVFKLTKDLKLINGIVNLLKRLKNEGFVIGLGSSAPTDSIKFILNKFNIKKYFDVVIGENDVKRHKPFPDVYLLAAKRLMVNPKMCVVFEDTNIGLKAAKMAKMKSIAITTSWPRNKLVANKIIDSYSEIKIKDLRGM